MASLEKRGGHYRIVFRHDGAKHQIPLGAVDEAEARACTARLELNLRDARSGRLVVPAGTDVGVFLLSNGAVAATPKAARVKVELAKVERDAAVEAARVTVGSIVAGYLAAQATSLEANSLKTLGIQLRHVAKTLGADLSAEDLTLARLQTHIERRRTEPGRRGRPVIAKTIRKEITAMGGAWGWAGYSGLVRVGYPSKGLKYPRAEERLRFQTRAEIERQIARGGLDDREREELWDRLYLDRGEIGEIVAYFDTNARHRFLAVMVALAAHTGMRRSEMLRARKADVDLEAGTITIREKKRVKGTSTTRAVPLSPSLTRTLTDWLAVHPGGTMLLAKANDDPLSRSPSPSISGVTGNEADDHFGRTRFGSPWAKVRGFHVLRHSFISACAASGVDVRNVQSWCGHMTPEMSAWYTHLCPATQRTAMDVVFR
jgi:integrase